MFDEEKVAKPMFVHTNLKPTHRVKICAKDLDSYLVRVLWRMGQAVVLARAGVI